MAVGVGVCVCVCVCVCVGVAVVVAGSGGGGGAADILVNAFKHALMSVSALSLPARSLKDPSCSILVTVALLASLAAVTLAPSWTAALKAAPALRWLPSGWASFDFAPASRGVML